MRRRDPGALPVPDLSLLIKILHVLAVLFIFTSHASGGGVEGEIPYPPHFEKIVQECLREYGDVRWIQVNEFLTLREQGEWVLLDVRNIIERALSIIPGAISIEEFEKDPEMYKKRNILVYDTVGCRSAEYSHTMETKGFRLYSLWGGALAWAWNGQSFLTPGGLPTKALHVFQRKWNVLPPGYEGGW